MAPLCLSHTAAPLCLASSSSHSCSRTQVTPGAARVIASSPESRRTPLPLLFQYPVRTTGANAHGASQSVERHILWRRSLATDSFTVPRVATHPTRYTRVESGVSQASPPGVSRPGRFSSCRTAGEDRPRPATPATSGLLWREHRQQSDSSAICFAMGSASSMETAPCLMRSASVGCGLGAGGSDNGPSVNLDTPANVAYRHRISRTRLAIDCS